jgi:EipB-like
MRSWFGRSVGPAVALILACAPAGLAADIDPHRALYSLALESARSGSGILGASGAMYYQWGETCDGWTVEQRFQLGLLYAEAGGSELSSTLVTWEAKNGLRYRFDERRMHDGDLDEELHGEAHLDGPGKGGVAQFTKPENVTIKLAPGVIFPTAHTILLIDRATAGDQFMAREVFDGSSVDNATQITAVIGAQQKPLPIPNIAAGKNRNRDDPARSKLLQRPSWPVRLAFFPADSKSETPDYELGMRLLSNGVSQAMELDYGDYVIKAKLDDIEALPKPAC